MSERLLRVREVADMIGVGVTTVWEWSRSGRLPKPFRLSARLTVWKESEIQRFIAELTREGAC